MPEGEVSDSVSGEEFQCYWKYIANKNTQSLASGVHFEHYKAASYDKDLSTLKAVKLLLAAATGIPLVRWGTGITILLEKVHANIYIDKMQAICIFEADFNYLNKFVFEKQMMGKALDAGIVPGPSGAVCKTWLKSQSRCSHVGPILQYCMVFTQYCGNRECRPGELLRCHCKLNSEY
jgi:hypothetical protein